MEFNITMRCSPPSLNLLFLKKDKNTGKTAGKTLRKKRILNISSLKQMTCESCKDVGLVGRFCAIRSATHVDKSLLL